MPPKYKVTYVEAGGKAHTVDVAEGWSLMEGAVKHLIPGIDADCGGACACATCQIYVAPGWEDKLPPKSEDLVARLTKANVALNDTLLWWVAGGIDVIELFAKAVETSGSTDPQGIIAYLNGLNKYPGYFGTYTFTPTQHNGYPTDEIVMSEASTARNGTFAVAPGYT